MIDTSICCVITVYCRTKADELRECLNSIYRQKSILPSEVLICFDGADSFFLLNSIPSPPDDVQLRTLFLPINVGPGRARHIAILSTNTKYIAIMDSDDICSEHRFSCHHDAFSSGCDLNAGQLCILTDRSTNIVRKTSLTSREFFSNVRYRTPLNNQTLAFSRYLYMLSGGYPDMRVAEDWVFMARIYPLAANPKLSSQVFVFFRENSNYSVRRTTISHSLCEFRASWHVCLLGLSTPLWPILVLSSRLVFRNIMPSRFLKTFESFFRGNL